MSNMNSVGDSTEYTNKFNKPWRTGSVRTRNGQLQILVNEWASYGGGSGPIWATEGAAASLTLQTGGSYIVGACIKIHASSRSIEFAIHQSPFTWGMYTAGDVVILPISDIARYDTNYTNHIDQMEAVDKANPKPIPAEDVYSKLMSSLAEELTGQFDAEVNPSLTKALISATSSLKQYSQRYVGSQKHSGHDDASHAKWAFHKSMRQLIRVLEQDGLNKYKTPGCK